MNTSQGTQTTAEPRLGSGDVIGRYRVIGLIAEGRSGPLYLAEKSGSQRPVAVRCIRPEVARRPELREQLLAAAKVVARCEHPNVARVLEMAEQQGRYFVSLEYLPGESLATILASPERRAQLTPDIAAHVVKRVASAVLHARAVGAALSPPVRDHGVDIDPADVVITRSGAVQWLGVASASAAPGAASPAGSEGRSTAHELGKLLCTCLAHSAPADVPAALGALAARTVSPDPRERFESLQALSEALDRYFFGQELRPTPAHLRRCVAKPEALERATAPLGPRPRPLWSSSARLSGLASAPRSIDPRRPRRQWLPAAAFVAALAAGTALLPLVPGRAGLAHPRKTTERPDARVDVRSTPPDAAVFVDGEPTGLFTPAVLKGLPANRPLQVRVVKAGFAPQQRRLALATGSVQTLVYELVASDGHVVFAGAPRGARFYVDGQEVPVDDQQPVTLAVGPHAIRVEAAGALAFSERVVVAPGEQTIRIINDRAAR